MIVLPVLPVLQEELPTDIINEVCLKWMDPDFFFCFYDHASGNKDVDPHSKVIKWYRLIKRLIVLKTQQSKQIFKFLIVSRSVEFNLQQYPLLLLSVLRVAIKHNHLASIHLLLDTYPFLAEKKFAAPLFCKALKCNRPHLLRLFVVLWNFEVSNSSLENCITWIESSPHRAKNFEECKKECTILIL